MSDFILSLAVLSAVLTALSGVMIFARRFFLKGREGLLYPLWIFLLILSITPIKLPESNAGYIKDSQHEVHTTDSSVFQSSSADSVITLIPAHRPNLLVSLRRAASTLVSKFETIAAFIFALWLIGASAHLTASMIEYVHTARLLYSCSTDCSKKKAYRRLRRILLECKQDMNFHRSVRLRMIDEDMFCSPCVNGCIFPILYLEPGCFDFSDSELKCVISHELTHLKRLDMLWKLIALLSSSVHWFNPLIGRILSYAFEDCELACDYHVIRAYGNDICPTYMNAILDFAERFSLRSKSVGFEGGLFFAKSANAEFLKRRYVNMKKYKHSLLTLAATSVVAVGMLGTSIAALSSSSMLEVGRFTNTLSLSPSVEIMLRAYYGLSADDFITPELLDGITTLEIRADRTIDEHILAEFVVNGEEGYAKAVPLLALMTYWDSLVRPTIDSMNDSTERAFLSEKLTAYYRLESPYDHKLAERALRELSLTYPVIREKGSIYIFDPNISNAELKTVYSQFDELGLLDDWKIDSEIFDTSCLECFRNLKEVKLVGFSLPE